MAAQTSSEMMNYDSGLKVVCFFCPHWGQKSTGVCFFWTVFFFLSKLLWTVTMECEEERCGEGCHVAREWRFNLADDSESFTAALRLPGPGKKNKTPRTHCTAALIVECRCYDAGKTYLFVLHKTASCSALPTYFPGVEFPRLTALKLQYSRYKIKCRILYIFLGRRVLEKEKSLSCEACIGHWMDNYWFLWINQNTQETLYVLLPAAHTDYNVTHMFR